MFIRLLKMFGLCFLLFGSSAVLAGHALHICVERQCLNITKQEIKQISIPQPSSAPAVNIELTTHTAQQLNQLTKASIGKSAQISFDNTIISSPTIRSALGGKMQLAVDNWALAEDIVHCLS